MSSRGINKVIIIGNLGQDPEVKFMPSGGAVCNITVATSESWKDKQTGEQKQKTEWHRVVIFGKKAEIAGQYLTKGSKVYLEGKLQTRKWQNQQGVDQYTTEIVLEDFNGELQFLDSKPQDASQGNQSQGNYQQNQASHQAAPHQQQGNYQQAPQQGGYQQNPVQQGNAQGGYQQNQNMSPSQNLEAKRANAEQQRASNQNNNQAVNNHQQQGGNNQGGYQQQAPAQQGGYQQQATHQHPKVNPQEPSIDFDDDIPFAPIGLQYNNAMLYCL